MQYQITTNIRDSLNTELEHYMNCRLAESCNRCKKLIKDLGAIKI